MLFGPFLFFSAFFLFLIFNALFASLFQYIEKDDLPVRLYSPQKFQFLKLFRAVYAQKKKKTTVGWSLIILVSDVEGSTL